MIYLHLIGKQESLESRHKYWNQAKTPLKIPKDSGTKFIMSDPSAIEALTIQIVILFIKEQ